MKSSVAPIRALALRRSHASRSTTEPDRNNAGMQVEQDGQHGLSLRTAANPGIGGPAASRSKGELKSLPISVLYALQKPPHKITSFFQHSGTHEALGEQRRHILSGSLVGSMALGS